MGDIRSKICVLICLVLAAHCHLGVDVSALLNTTVYDCIKKAGYSFACIRGYHSYGAVDTNAVHGLTNAKEAGLTTDVYLFPCRGKNATTQVNDMISAISGNLYGMVWLDI